jgi:threonine dehydrogenase-like Zn-dependent dehydrogenase
MKGLVYTSPFHVEIQSLAEPAPAPDEVVIRVAACGICGSDLQGFQGKSRIRVPPMVMGHEFGGRVVALGDAVGSGRGLTVGQRVVVQPVVGDDTCVYCLNGRPNICPRRELIGGQRPGAFAEYVKAPVRAVYPISDRLSDRAATLVEPLGNAVHMLGLAAGQPGSGPGVLDRTVVVLGAGTLGLLTVALARLAGARRVIVTDVDAGRLRVASRLGADEALNARDDGARPAGFKLTQRILAAIPGGAEVVIDAAGYTASRQQAIAVAAPGATVVLLGLSDPTSELPVLDIINREIAVRGSYASTDAEFRHAISILEDGKIDSESWIRPAELEEGQRYFDGLVAHEAELVKVVFSL